MLLAVSSEFALCLPAPDSQISPDKAPESRRLREQQFHRVAHDDVDWEVDTDGGRPAAIGAGNGSGG